MLAGHRPTVVFTDASIRPEAAELMRNWGGAMDVDSVAATIAVYSGDELKDYGNLLLIKHDGGYVTAYAHADRLLVQRGDVVTKGQVIAYAGHTGDVSTPQLHFEIRKGSSPVDPRQFLNGA